MNPPSVVDLWSAQAKSIYKRFSSSTPLFKPPKAYWNWLRANYEMIAQPSRIKARPLKLSIEITNSCQLRCPICPTGLKVQDRAIGQMDINLFQKLMDEVGDYVFFIDFFNWGEPLISNQLEQFLEIANSKKIWTCVSTNLSLPLSDEKIRKIIESGLNDLIVSADGASEGTYTTYRIGGNFELVLQNMKKFVAIKAQMGRRNPYITWRFLVFRFNEQEVEKAKEMARELGVDRILFSAPYIDQVRFPDWTAETPKFNRYMSEDSTVQLDEKKQRNRCGWHYISTAINPDGSVAPCCGTFSKKDDFAFINGENSSSYMSAVNSEKFVTVRDRFAGRIKEPVDIICENCPTPDIMDCNNLINKMITVLTGVNCIEKVRHIVSAAKT